MDHDRKRQIRLVIALSVAVLLAVALIYTSFSAGTEAKEPADLISSGEVGATYQVSGQVVADSGDSPGREFQIADENGDGEELTVSYPDGLVPDPYRVGRDVVLTGQLDDAGTFQAEADSLITKCPSKFADEVENDTNVQFVD